MNPDVEIVAGLGTVVKRLHHNALPCHPDKCSGLRLLSLRLHLNGPRVDLAGEAATPIPLLSSQDKQSDEKRASCSHGCDPVGPTRSSHP